MSVRYVGLTVQLHGLAITTEDDLERLVVRLHKAIDAIDPPARFVDPDREVSLTDIVVEIEETAGELEEAQCTTKQ